MFAEEGQANQGEIPASPYACAERRWPLVRMALSSSFSLLTTCMSGDPAMRSIESKKLSEQIQELIKVAHEGRLLFR